MTEIAVTMYTDSYEDYVLSLAPELASRCELTLIQPASWTTPAAGDSAEQRSQGAVRPVSLPRVRDPRRFRAISGVVSSLGRSGADIVHVQQSGDPWFSLAMLAHRPKVPTVVSIHDVTPHPGDGTQIPGGNLMQRAWKHRVARFIVHAPDLVGELSHAWGIDPGRVRVIDHGELGSLYRSRVGVQRPRATREPATVLFYGRRWPYKGLSVLVSALNLMASVTGELRLIVAGQGEPLEPTLAGLSTQVAVERHDKRVDDATTVDLFDRATLVCLPYVEASQSGVAALAIGLGTPVVASNVGGIPRLIRDGREGLLVPPGDPHALATALTTVIDDPTLQASMAAACIDRANGDLSPAAIAQATLAVYREVLGR
jgi:glycosyltransferase involved in cell wall biosynthesis